MRSVHPWSMKVVISLCELPTHAPLHSINFKFSMLAFVYSQVSLVPIVIAGCWNLRVCCAFSRSTRLSVLTVNILQSKQTFRSKLFASSDFASLTLQYFTSKSFVASYVFVVFVYNLPYRTYLHPMYLYSHESLQPSLLRKLFSPSKLLVFVSKMLVFPCFCSIQMFYSAMRTFVLPLHTSVRVRLTLVASVLNT